MISEKDFIKSHDYENRLSSRYGIVCSLFGWACIILVYFLLNKDNLIKIALSIVCGLFPLFILIIILTFKKKYSSLYQPLTALANSLAGFLMLYIVIFLNHDYMFALMMTPTLSLFAFFILRIRTKLAIICTLSYIIPYELILLFSSNIDINLRLYGTIGTLVTEISCIIGGYILERLSRQLFYQAYELKNKKEILESKSYELEESLKTLKMTQEQLIINGKMAAMGQLISGIAHEINTPLGAINASIDNISVYINKTIQEKLPILLRILDDNEQMIFFSMLNKSIDNVLVLSSKEERKLKKEIKEKLAGLGIESCREIAETLVSMGVYENIEAYIPLIKNKEMPLIMETSYELSDILKNTENINIAVKKASKIIFTLKTYSHFDNTGVKVEADISEGLETVLSLYHHNIKQNVDIIRRYDITPKIMCFPDDLIQMWTNLISNALHAMDYKGTIEIDIYGENNYVVVKITDSGTGIPDDIRDKIFEPFFTTKRQGEGTGLGLEIVKKIIVKHNGEVEVESIPGRTTFSVKLPMR